MDSPEPKKLKVSDDTKQAYGYESLGVQKCMAEYYAKLFPHKEMYRWLVYGNDSKNPQADPTFFPRREICFTLDGDIFVRYQSYKDGREMEAAIKARCPAKIDIGPVYNFNPQERLKYGSSFAPVSRELVFDVDLTDYDDVRTCGSGAHVCKKCWPLMAAAVKVMDRGLRREFGMEQLLWVFSGRRGVHCWVADESARCLTDEQRAAIAGWFSVFKGYEEGRAKIAIGSTAMHPAVKAAYGILEDIWLQEILPLQAPFEHPETLNALLRQIPDAGLVQWIRQKLESESNADVKRAVGQGVDVNVAKWNFVKKEVEAKAAQQHRLNRSAAGALERSLIEIVFAFCYPRLDLEVTKKRNHLLKAPFCVHPKTGKVCVPFDVEEVDNFDPDDVPTVFSLLEELAQIEKEATIRRRKEEEKDKQAQVEDVESPAAAADVDMKDATGAELEEGGGADPKAREQKSGVSNAASEPWRQTRMAAAVELFERSFLTPLQEANRRELLEKTRAKVALNQVKLEF